MLLRDLVNAHSVGSLRLDLGLGLSLGLHLCLCLSSLRVVALSGEERRMHRRHRAVDHRRVDVPREQVVFVLRQHRRVEEVHGELSGAGSVPVRREQRWVQGTERMRALHHVLLLREERRMPEAARAAVRRGCAAVIRRASRRSVADGTVRVERGEACVATVLEIHRGACRRRRRARALRSVVGGRGGGARGLAH